VGGVDPFQIQLQGPFPKKKGPFRERLLDLAIKRRRKRGTEKERNVSWPPTQGLPGKKKKGTFDNQSEKKKKPGREGECQKVLNPGQSPGQKKGHLVLVHEEKGGCQEKEPSQRHRALNVQGRRKTGLLKSRRKRAPNFFRGGDRKEKGKKRNRKKDNSVSRPFGGEKGVWSAHMKEEVCLPRPQREKENVLRRGRKKNPNPPTRKSPMGFEGGGGELVDACKWGVAFRKKVEKNQKKRKKNFPFHQA